jgi:acyl carrier protein
VRPSTELETAVIRRLSQHLDSAIDPSTVDCNASFFDPTGFYLGSYILDSLDLAEIVVTIETDLDVDILGSSDAERPDSISKLSSFIADAADPARLAAFSAEWDTSG